MASQDIVKHQSIQPFKGVPYLTDDQLKEARSLVKMGYQNIDIAYELNVSVTSVWKTLGDKGYRA